MDSNEATVCTADSMPLSDGQCKQLIMFYESL